ncbi:COG2605 Predicted kinase related to galactokinase and mevalonate kinase [Candidatus Methylopumilus universalis]|uniref:GHMP family kinase ATP-binding protein n=1 Tax=Candidatus Methylopumilus universalis TaxID=2588536 RepID=UPI003BEF1904
MPSKMPIQIGQKPMSSRRLPRTVTTITPQRISFVGGGTDLPSFYSRQDGSVISSAIDKYVYVTVKRHSPLFQEEYRLSYSKTEHTNSLDKIENSIARECLRLVHIDPPLYIATAADLPASSGLGSSSSFAVGLLNALHLLKGERVSPAQLAEEACEVEINILGNPIGKQDQYAAAFGGLNHIVFKKNGRVEIDHLVLQNNLIDEIFENSLLIWTGIQRNASDILVKQNENVAKNFANYELIIDNNKTCKDLMLNPPSDFLNQFGKLLEKSWQTKKSLEQTISSNEMDEIHNRVKILGGYGGKLNGAGGGGFFFEIIPKESHAATLSFYGPSRVLKVAYEPFGSRLLSETF